ncbi:G-type lectin S-receptor-like serine/threonine-protein kinase At4g27290 [Salvia splendens]|uniref:G-type lectin S-receptor-like serine/threonine-protein kinase At4g27290 n=1 Tax=Salvia splendens TaxID=180675 RepID=UPI001C2729C9|nr:G-type lectin S-receptor-like serine/threonine-protein kinase At4g27290 [Salvia splendens]
MELYYSFAIITITNVLLLLITHAMDTLNPSHTLRHTTGDTLISSGGTFELGFFNPDNSNKWYVGVWYKRIAPKTVVWVANRDNPLPDSSATLTLTPPGRLLLLSAANATIWSTNISNILHNPVAQLLDSGNLVVRDGIGLIVWQSFDFPTDTLLPGMKLGWNYATGREAYMTSAKNGGDPASGDFTFRCDPTGYPQNVLKNGGSVQYKSGPWNGLGFSGGQNLKRNNLFKFGVVMTKAEVYYHYELLNRSVITRFQLSESGVAQRFVWNDEKQEWAMYHTVQVDGCDMYNSCGAHGSCNADVVLGCACLERFVPKDPVEWSRQEWRNGCVRSKPLNCKSGDVFLKYSGIKLPDTQLSWFNASLSLRECNQVCSKNCSCMAYASLDISRGQNGCLLWFGDLVNIRDMSPGPGHDIYIRLAASESRGKKRQVVIVTLCLMVGVILVCLSLLLSFQMRKRMNHQSSEIVLGLDDQPDESDNKELELPQFDLSIIVKATNDFSMDNKLGEGGFGPVYKGVLDEGQEIAVKRMSKTSHQGVDEFKNEVICIAKLQHRNLVKLLGWCVQGTEKMLVYEYMTNKSLDLILFNPTRSLLLDWPRRFNIINGIARGLMYLHQDSRLRVIHRDLKASNILLDCDMNPKISDFGLARTFGGNETGGNTSRVVGTYGYMSPEYAVDGMFSVKSDVFSFGVIVLEIVSGKRNRGFVHSDHRLNLLGHAWMLYEEDRSIELVEPCAKKSCDISEVTRSIHVGLLCVQQHPEDRPSMSSVVMMLSNGGALPEAKHPGFFTGREILKSETSVSTTTSSSTNAITISLVEAR